ncbi:hypothetical protein IFR05_008408 [Cadophora sp. M221]|nr:hypothetical protein IFR05_008408 [Cadophora sp. M221]
MDMIKAAPMYTYNPLSRPESIRILVLQPSEDHTAPLLCDLVHDDRHQILLDIEQKRGYEAVSYTWGDPIFSHEILCGEENARLAITPNVDSLLRHLRKTSKPRRLWVDAICLNQTDHIEKRVQVGLMGEIYRQATKVHVWLGDSLRWRKGPHPLGQLKDPNGFSKLMGFFRFTALEKSSHDEGTFLQTPSSRVFQGEKELVSSLQMFLHAPWFQRRWTIQEASLNRHTIVRYGRSKILWEDMSAALGILNSNMALDHVASTSRETALAIRSQTGTILDLLYKHHEALCFDPRDRITALLSVATNNAASNQNSSVPMRWTVDYEASWQENYLNFCQSAINNGDIVQIFAHLRAFGSLSQKSDSWPSWVPDWTRRRLRRAYNPNYSFPEPPEPSPFAALVTSQTGIPVLKVNLTRSFMIENVAGGHLQQTDSCM